jgi:hypothetical protein
MEKSEFFSSTYIILILIIVSSECLRSSHFPFVSGTNWQGLFVMSLVPEFQPSLPPRRLEDMPMHMRSSLCTRGMHPWVDGVLWSMVSFSTGSSDHFPLLCVCSLWLIKKFRGIAWREKTSYAPAPWTPQWNRYWASGASSRAVRKIPLSMS